ncbi:hypothetical protein ACWCQL_30010 [Streptomyces sp. NPDC002073]
MTAPRRTGSAVRRRILSATATASVLTALLAGCAEEKKTADAAPPKPSASPSPSADPKAAEKAALLGVYREFWDAQLKVYTTGSMRGTGIERVAGGKAYTKVQVTVLYHQQRGTVMKGKPRLSPKVTALNTSKNLHTATVTDCLDSTGYVQVEKDTGEPVKLADANRRHVATYSALRHGGSWQIRDFDIDRDRTC